MKAGKKEKSTKDKSSGWNGTKIALVVLGVLFVFVMIFTSMGMSWITSLKAAKAGDVAQVDYTIYDDDQRVVLTSNQRIYNVSVQQGHVSWLTSQLTTQVNASGTEELVPVPSFSYTYGQAEYALFSPETDAITQGLVGMRQGETKRIAFEQLPGFQRELTSEQFDAVGGNFTNAKVGDQIMLAFTVSPAVNVENNTSLQFAVRTGYLIGKTVDSVIVNYGYPYADVTLLQLQSRS